MRNLLSFSLMLMLVVSCGDTGKPSNGPVATKTNTRSAPVKPSHVVVIGIDGASWYVMRQLARDGEIPTIARLMKDGAWGDLQTLSPTESPTIWTTIATGYSPDRHGITSFTSVVPGTGATTLVSSTSRREAAIWNLASDAHIRVGVVNWWATFPAETVDGFVVSDRANLRRRFGYQSVLGLNDKQLGKVGEGETYPAQLLPHILDIIGTNTDVPPAAKTFLFDPLPKDLQTEVAKHQTLVRDQRLSVLKFVVLQDHAAATATRVALKEIGMPKLLMVYFSGLDAAEHQFWAYYEPHRYPVPPSPEEVKNFKHVIPGYYRYVDSQIADLLRQLPPDSLIVLVSDHGHDANLYWDPKAQIGDYAKWSMGNHGNAPAGILLFAGPGVQAGQTRRISVYDVTPTLLALIGLPPTRDMPGRVITEAFTPERRASLPRDRVDRQTHARPAGNPVAADVDPELLEKLRALGYIR
ncbi:MAG: alkaline phosphatase family protein [Thermoanaerobaculia bacterium]